MARQVATAAAMLGALLGFAGGALPQTPPANAPSTLAPVAPAAPATVTLPTPGMAGSLAFSAIPNSIDVGPLGKWYVDGVLSGLGLVQSNHVASDTNAAADMSNGQVIIQKIDGIVQFYTQIGAYSIPALGTPYSHLTDTSDAINNFYGPVPQAFLKIAPISNFSIEGSVKANEYRRFSAPNPTERAAIRQQNSTALAHPLWASGQYRIYSDNAHETGSRPINGPPVLRGRLWTSRPKSIYVSRAHAIGLTTAGIDFADGVLLFLS
jgi:hypothetical protein